MNRNTLLIAIAAIVMVGIAIGVMLSGAGQTGSLSGSIGATPTTFTLNVSTCSVPTPAGNVNFTLSGELRDSGGNPVAGQAIWLSLSSCSNGACAATPSTESAVTGQDGGFSFVKSEPPTRNYNAETTFVQYSASFRGDEQYAASFSNSVKKLC
ncbi:MAG: hypothetical protein ABFC38_07015 [Methanospirillum sp.]